MSNDPPALAPSQEGEASVPSGGQNSALLPHTVIRPRAGLSQAHAPARFEQSLARPFIFKSLSEETRRSYQRVITEFFRAHSSRHPAEITPTDVLRWRDLMVRDGRRPTTIATKLAVIRSFFEYLRASGVVPLNPASTKLVSAPQLPEDGAGRALTPREVRYLLSGPDREMATGARDYALLTLMLRTSMRVSEVTGLRVSALKWTHGRWVVRLKVKGGRERTLPLPKDLKQAIDAYLKLDEKNRRQMGTGGEDAYIFQADVRRRNFGEVRPLSTRHVWHLVRKWGRFTGVGHLTPHDLRRTAITRALDLGKSYRQVQMMSGHLNINSVVRYDRQRLNLDENAINTLDYEEAE